MAKPKQKSGLGRGLNALFDSADVASNQKPVEPSPTPEPKVQQVKEPETKTPAKPSSAVASDIYISEDAIENAKVVERAARPAKQGEKTVSRTSHPAKAKPAAKATPVTPIEEPKKEVKKPEAPKDTKGSIAEVPLVQVQPNPDQPRTHFKKEEIEELAESIKKDGLLQPILVRKMENGYQIIAGERRWQACRSLGMETVPVRFWLADEDKALELALIENIQRSDLNPIEEAYGYKRLMERKNMTQSELAQTVSKGRSTVANALRLLDLPEEAQQLLFEEKITAGHARAILSVPSSEGRMTITKKLMEEKLSVRETEALARLIAGKEKATKEGTNKRTPAPASFKKAARGLTKLLGAPVRVKTVQGKNKIEIQFADEEELQRIFDAISQTKE